MSALHCLGRQNPSGSDEALRASSGAVRMPPQGSNGNKREQDAGHTQRRGESDAIHRGFSFSLDVELYSFTNSKFPHELLLLYFINLVLYAFIFNHFQWKIHHINT